MAITNDNNQVNNNILFLAREESSFSDILVQYHGDKRSVVIVFDVTLILLNLLTQFPFKRRSEYFGVSDRPDTQKHILPKFLFPDIWQRCHDSQAVLDNLWEHVNDLFRTCTTLGFSQSLVIVGNGAPPMFYVPHVRKQAYISSFCRQHLDLVGFTDDAYAGSELHEEFVRHIIRVGDIHSVKHLGTVSWKHDAIRVLKQHQDSAIVYWGIDKELALLWALHMQDRRDLDVFVAGSILDYKYIWNTPCTLNPDFKSKVQSKDNILEELLMLGFANCLPMPAVPDEALPYIPQPYSTVRKSPHSISTMVSNALSSIPKSSLQHALDGVQSKNSPNWCYQYYEQILNTKTEQAKDNAICEYSRALETCISYFRSCKLPEEIHMYNGMFPPLTKDIHAFREKTNQQVDHQANKVQCIKEKDVLLFRLLTSHPDLLLCISDKGDKGDKGDDHCMHGTVTRCLRNIVREPMLQCMYMYPSHCGLCCNIKGLDIWHYIPVLPSMMPAMVMHALKQPKISYQARY